MRGKGKRYKALGVMVRVMAMMWGMGQGSAELEEESRDETTCDAETRTSLHVTYIGSTGSSAY